MGESATEVKVAVPETTIEQESLKAFYRRVYPFEHMHAWLSYGDDSYFSKREFNYTLMPGGNQSIYVRNQSYANLAEFRQEMTKAAPHKIDIGAVYTHPPRLHASYGKALQAKEKELVFDVDMDDYSAVRQCCEGGKAKRLCERCWPYLHISIQVLKKALQSVFGFKQVLFIYSGRRGIHCWVADPRARKLENRARAAILDFLIVDLTFDKSGTPPMQPVFDKLHPFLQEVYNEILVPEFNTIIEAQGLFDGPEQWDLILSFLPQSQVGNAMRNTLSERWAQDKFKTSPEHKWSEFVKAVEKELKADGKQRGKRQFTSDPVLDVIFAFTYPRFDKNVSTMVNHLLKAPFCVHPGTGRVCVPLNPRTTDQFDPDKVPSLDVLLDEINEEGRPVSLEPYLKYFVKKFLAPVQHAVAKEAAGADPMEF